MLEEDVEAPQPLTYPVALLSNRHKWAQEEDSANNIAVIDEILDALVAKHSTGLVVVGLNDDIGFGQVVKRACFIKNVRYVTYMCRMEQFPQLSGIGSNQALNQWFHLGKMSAVIHTCREFLLFTNRKPNMIPGPMAVMNPLEDVIARIRTQPQMKWAIYNASNTIIEKSTNAPSIG